MRIGVPKEIKVLENRVGLTPASVRELVHHGHEVVVERDAGSGHRRRDDDYRRGAPRSPRRAGRRVRRVRHDRQGEGAASGGAARCCEPGQMLFTYLHLAPDPEQARDLVASGAICIAYETVTSADRRLAAARADVRSRRAHGGAGGRAFPRESARRQGHPARRRARRRPGQGRRAWRWRRRHARDPHCARDGRATSGCSTAASMSLRRLWTQFGRPLNTVFSTRDAIERHVATADLVIGGVLVPARLPRSSSPAR